MKTITTATEITFKKTGEKFTLTQTDTGFDVKQIRLSKNTPHEPYSFQELLDLYEAGHISIEGFEETDGPLIQSILTNYIHTTQIEALKADITRLNGEKEELAASNLKLTGEKDELTTANSELTNANTALASTNKEFSEEIKVLNKKISELDKALEAMNEES